MGTLIDCHVLFPASFIPISVFLNCLHLPEKDKKNEDITILVSLCPFLPQPLKKFCHLGLLVFIPNKAKNKSRSSSFWIMLGFQNSCHNKICHDFTFFGANLSLKHRDPWHRSPRDKESRGVKNIFKILFKKPPHTHTVFMHKHVAPSMSSLLVPLNSMKSFVWLLTIISIHK